MANASRMQCATASSASLLARAVAAARRCFSASAARSEHSCSYRKRASAASGSCRREVWWASLAWRRRRQSHKNMVRAAESSRCWRTSRASASSSVARYSMMVWCASSAAWLSHMSSTARFQAWYAASSGLSGRGHGSSPFAADARSLSIPRANQSSGVPRISQILWFHSSIQLGARAGGCIHIAAKEGKSAKLGYQRLSVAVDEGKWAGDDPPFPIFGGGGREFFILIPM